MKAYVTLVMVLLICAYLIEMRLINRYKPSVELLNRTTQLTGKLRLAAQGRGEVIAELNGVPLMCRVNFIGAQEQCIQRVPGLGEGKQLTVAIANVPALMRTVQVAMSIAVEGRQVYAVTPQQVINDWTRSSRKALIVGPALVLFLVFLMPLLFSASFRSFLSAAFE